METEKQREHGRRALCVRFGNPEKMFRILQHRAPVLCTEIGDKAESKQKPPQRRLITTYVLWLGYVKGN